MAASMALVWLRKSHFPIAWNSMFSVFFERVVDFFLARSQNLVVDYRQGPDFNFEQGN